MREKVKVRWPVLATEYLDLSKEKDKAYCRGFFDAQKAFEELNPHVESFSYEETPNEIERGKE